MWKNARICRPLDLGMIADVRGVSELKDAKVGGCERNQGVSVLWFRKTDNFHQKKMSLALERTNKLKGVGGLRKFFLISS